MKFHSGVSGDTLQAFPGGWILEFVRRNILRDGFPLGKANTDASQD